MVAKSTIRTSIDNLLGDNADITDAKIDSVMESENEDLLEMWDWERRRVFVAFDTDADISTGTASATDGSTTVTFSGPTLTDATVFHRYLRVSGNDQIHKIVTFNDATSVEIETAWELADVSGGTYEIFTLFYSIASDVQEVLQVSESDRVLTEIAPEELNVLDPDRDETGTEPTHWTYGPRDNSGNVTIEVYPRPTVKTQFNVRYLKRGTIASDTDEPVYPPFLLKWRGASAAADFLFAQTADRHWERKALRWDAKFERMLPIAIRADSERSGFDETVDDVFGDSSGLSEDFFVDHDFADF